MKIWWVYRIHYYMSQISRRQACCPNKPDLDIDVIYALQYIKPSCTRVSRHQQLFIEHTCVYMNIEQRTVSIQSKERWVYNEIYIKRTVTNTKIPSRLLCCDVHPDLKEQSIPYTIWSYYILTCNDHFFQLWNRSTCGRAFVAVYCI